MDFERLRGILASLPRNYEPLLLTFTDEPRWWDDRSVVIGSDGGTELRVDMQSGAVASFCSSDEIAARFLNSNADRLAACVAAYQEYAAAIDRAADEAGELHEVARLRDALMKIDPAALADPEAWWAMVVEQAEHGLV